jgi:hypothetical protein
LPPSWNNIARQNEIVKEEGEKEEDDGDEPEYNYDLANFKMKPKSSFYKTAEIKEEEEKLSFSVSFKIIFREMKAVKKTKITKKVDFNLNFRVW